MKSFPAPHLSSPKQSLTSPFFLSDFPPQQSTFPLREREPLGFLLIVTGEFSNHLVLNRLLLQEIPNLCFHLQLASFPDVCGPESTFLINSSYWLLFVVLNNQDTLKWACHSFLFPNLQWKASFILYSKFNYIRKRLFI